MPSGLGYGARVATEAVNARRRVASVTALVCAALAISPASAYAARCGAFTKVATAYDKNVWAGPIAGFGWHGNYNIAIVSYLRRCGSNVTSARHQVYIDSRRVPRGQTFAFNIWTRRSDGRWKAVKPRDGFSFEVAGSRKIQETIAYQRRTTYPPARLTHVRLTYWVYGTLRPKTHTMMGVYKSFIGPGAAPAG